MSIMKDWTTLELIEFLNSYNRVINKCEELEKGQYVSMYQGLYQMAFEELYSRSELLAMAY